VECDSLWGIRHRMFRLIRARPPRQIDLTEGLDPLSRDGLLWLPKTYRLGGIKTRRDRNSASPLCTQISPEQALG
jgi:hypothetical protein